MSFPCGLVVHFYTPRPSIVGPLGGEWRTAGHIHGWQLLYSKVRCPCCDGIFGQQRTDPGRRHWRCLWREWNFPSDVWWGCMMRMYDVDIWWGCMTWMYDEDVWWGKTSKNSPTLKKIDGFRWRKPIFPSSSHCRLWWMWRKRWKPDSGSATVSSTPIPSIGSTTRSGKKSSLLRIWTGTYGPFLREGPF